jgi:YHS domain-containing protein
VIRLLIWLLLIYIGYRSENPHTGPTAPPPDAATGRDNAEVTHRDPVCGVYVSEDDAVIGTLDGHRHYFCSMACLERFREQLDHTPS